MTRKFLNSWGPFTLLTFEIELKYKCTLNGLSVCLIAYNHKFYHGSFMSYPLHGGTPTHHPFYLWNNIAVRTIKILTNPWLRRPFRHYKVPWDTVILKCFNMVKNLTQKFIIIVTWIMDFLENLPEISIWTLITFAFNSLIHEGGICFDFRNVHFDDVTTVESFLVVRRQIRQSCYILGTKHYCSNHY